MAQGTTDTLEYLMELRLRRFDIRMEPYELPWSCIERYLWDVLPVYPELEALSHKPRAWKAFCNRLAKRFQIKDAS